MNKCNKHNIDKIDKFYAIDSDNNPVCYMNFCTLCYEEVQLRRNNLSHDHFLTLGNKIDELRKEINEKFDILSARIMDIKYPDSLIFRDEKCTKCWCNLVDGSCMKCYVKDYKRDTRAY